MPCHVLCWVCVALLMLVDQQAALTKPRAYLDSEHRGDKLHQVLKSKVVVVRKGMGAGGKHAYNLIYRIPRAWQQEAKRGMVAAFWLRFDDNFEWGCRGKVGGLFVGPGKANDRKHSVDGASNRLMWTADGDATAYIYVPLGTEHLQPDPLFRPRGTQSENDAGVNWLADEGVSLGEGTWVYVEIGVKLNTFDRRGRPKPNGLIVMQIGHHTFTLENVALRTRPEHGVSRFSFTVFHGGGCKATRTSRLEINNAALFRWRD